MCKYYVTTTGKEKKNVVRELSIFSLAATGGLLYTDDETFYSFLDPEAVGSACSLKFVICARVSRCAASQLLFFLVFRGWPAAMH